MPAPITAPMPPDLDLGDAYTIRVSAVDPTTGADVAGVDVSAVSIMCVQLAGSPLDDLTAGPFMLVPGPNA